jgi:hypothetical protein
MAKVKQLPERQRYQKALLFVSLLLFPVTLYYFSPVIIMESASQGIVNASFIVFGLMFVSSLFERCSIPRVWVVSPLSVAGSPPPSIRPCSSRIARSGGPMAGSGDPFGAKWATTPKRVTARVWNIGKV